MSLLNFLKKRKQTKDNNVSVFNKYENTELTKEFLEYSKNMTKTLALLVRYFRAKELIETGLLKTDAELIYKAQEFYDELLQNKDFVRDNGLLRNDLCMTMLREIGVAE